MTVTVYSFEDADGNEYGSFTTQDYQQAKEYARENRLRVIANEFEWADSEPLEDFTEEDEDESATAKRNRRWFATKNTK